MIVSHLYKFIFIKTLKTAGTSIEIFLSQFCGVDDIVTPIYPQEYKHFPRNYMDAHGRIKFYNHISAEKIKSELPQAIWNSYYKFCFERNPWDKTLSHYHMLNYRSGYKLSFDDYMSSQKFCLNYPLYTDQTRNNIIVDQVAKYENLNQELDNIFTRLGIPFESGLLNIQAKASYRQDRKPYSVFFSKDYEKYRQVVAQAFEKEIRLHGYTFD